MNSDLGAVAHRHHDYFSPISRVSVHELIALLQLPSSASCVDYGCGRGQLLLDIMQLHGSAYGVGYDANETFVKQANARAFDANLAERVDFCVRSVETTTGDRTADLAISFGSVHVFGGFRNAIRMLTNLLPRGGTLLIGDGYWKQKPSTSFLREFFDSSEDDLLYISQILAALDDGGLTAAYVKTSSDAEWEHYEGLWSRTLELAAEVANNVDGSDLMRCRARKSRNNYWLHGGRETLGFVAVVATRR